ncbi:hypothetical protein DH2020_041684 [Rehmannia glutinosa]|uniref:COBRA C-terminal domain-containing protein n=1 Tax=Rehmannia glutinosa TaxID=99300 RepID=A0ABR0UQV6_REHGL
MLMRRSGIRIPWKVLSLIAIVVFCYSDIEKCNAQDYGSSPETPETPPPEIEHCNGIFVSYIFQGREKEYPFVKNVSAQAWSFQAMATVLNTGSEELKSWQIFIGFQHHELLVSADGAVVVDGDGFPIRVGNNGTVLAGFPQSDLKTAIDTAADYTQMQVQINLKGTQFGVSAKSSPMPRTIKLVNDGYKCPAATRKGTYMHVCCEKDPKFKQKIKKTKYLAQVTIDNNNPLGRLDQWNLTWEWMRNEFINTMRGAYTHKKDPSECIYGPQGQYYQDFDFSTVMNCQKKPIIADLPPRAKTMTKWENCHTAAKMNWKIEGRLNPTYKCGPPIRVDPTEFPDPSGIDATTSAVASWQVTCNMTRPKPKGNKCCVSYSAYYSDSAVPCNTCACGCDEEARCDANAAQLLLPTDALLVPFSNRTEKALAFARIKHKPPPKKLPCPDNCGLKKAFPGFEKSYSFNGTKLTDVSNTIFMQGLPGLNYLVGEVNGTHPDRDPRVPGKQQSVISFTKKGVPHLNVAQGDGFPTKVFFNGEECALPKELPKRSGAHRSPVALLPAISIVVLTFLLLTVTLN